VKVEGEKESPQILVFDYELTLKPAKRLTVGYAYGEIRLAESGVVERPVVVGEYGVNPQRMSSTREDSSVVF